MNTAPAPARQSFRRIGAAALALLCLTAVSSAWAQWQWRDESGRRHFSDRPPPAGISEKDILQRPRGVAAPTAAPAATPAATTADTPSSGAAPSRPAAPAASPESPLEQRKQELEKAEAAKRKAEEKAAEDKAKQVRATNCESARRNKASLDSGARLTVPNARGEVEFLDEAGRAAQLRQANEQIRDNCR